MTSPPTDATLHPPRTWLILGERAGDNAQVLALGRALEWPTTVKQLRYDANEPTDFKDRGASLIGLDRANSDALEAPWPEAIIAIGRRSVPVARWIREQARAAGGAEMLHVHLGRPRVDLDLFDLVVTTPQYNLPPAPNVMEITLPVVSVDGEALGRAAAHWHARFAQLPRPWHAVLVGGPTPQLAFGAVEADRLLAELGPWHRRLGGSLLVTTSPRTDSQVVATLGASLATTGGMPNLFLPFTGKDEDNPYLALLALADSFVVSVDSASMVAEAATRRKPIYLFHLPKIAPRRKPGLKAAFSRTWRQRRKRRDDAGLTPDLGDRLYDLWTRRGKARPRRDIDQLERRLIALGIAQPLTANGAGAAPTAASDLSGPAEEVVQVVRRIHALWRERRLTAGK